MNNANNDQTPDDDTKKDSSIRLFVCSEFQKRSYKIINRINRHKHSSVQNFEKKLQNNQSN
ncbi:MAG: hypothetical protein ACI8RD_009723 [Bacillariaceae sp.]|jgi:hypothetical protein